MTTNNDAPLWFRQKTATTTGYITAGIVALLALCLSVGQGRATKFFLYSLASASCVGAKVLKKASDEAGYILEDTYTTTSLNRQRNLLAPAPKPLKEVKPKYEPVLFDWLTLKDGNLYPVILISAKQGAGKTTCAEWLGCLLGTEKRYVVSPHLKPTDFSGVDGRFGAGANYWREDDYQPTWTQITNSPDTRWTIHQTLTAIEDMVHKRLGEYALGKTDFEKTDIYLDEIVATTSYFKNKCPDKTQRKFMSTFLGMAFTEPRKVGVRFILLTQAETVEALGLTGMASLKDDSLFVRLNHNSINHAKRLNKQRYLSKDALDWLLKQPKPVMVEDALAQLPTIWEMRSLISDYANGKDNSEEDTSGEEAANAETYTQQGLASLASEEKPASETPAQPETLTQSGMPTSPAIATEIDTPKTPLFDLISEDVSQEKPASEPLEIGETLVTKDAQRLAMVLAGRTVAKLKSDTLAIIGTKRTDGKVWGKTLVIKDFWQLGTGGSGTKFGRWLWLELGLDESA